MPFNVMILAWLIYHAVGPLRHGILDAWLAPWSDWVTSTVLPKSGEIVALLVLLLVPVAIAGGVIELVDGLFFGLVGFAAHVVLLVYSTGRTPVEQLIEQYTHRYSKGDTQAAFHVVENYVDQVDVNNQAALHTETRRMLAYERYSALFAVIVWFVILGPLGALFYRLSQLLSTRCRHQGEVCFILHRRLQSLFYFLDWLPVRVLGLLFAIGGNAGAVLQQYKAALFTREAPHRFLDRLLMTSLYGETAEQGAMQGDMVDADAASNEVVTAIREIKFADQLIRRSVVVGIVIVRSLIHF
ncbi:regulatory signaling modulator protein AmpE [bacterium]|nr:regulatory signaling modulator protein AmpE [bacterium]